MKLLRTKYENFRNLAEQEINFEPSLNIICGKNAQGKTNILESIWIFTAGRSFRGSKDFELVKFGKETAKISLKAFLEQREQNLELKIEKGKRKIKINSVEKSNNTALVGKFCAVVFSPTHLCLIKEGPGFRRRFLDTAICQTKPIYAKLILKYNHTLLQRNALLKNAKNEFQKADTLKIWEELLAQTAAEITLAREKYIKELIPLAKMFYSGISCNKEVLQLRFKSSFLEQNTNFNLEEIKYLFLEKLEKTRKQDEFVGVTQIGPHRDDLDIKIDNKSARAFASQGQQRSCVLALKLAEATLLKQNTKKAPIVLLDDVMSELDTFRQDYILTAFKNEQVILTCCEPTISARLKDGNLISLENGRVLKK